MLSFAPKTAFLVASVSVQGFNPRFTGCSMARIERISRIIPEIRMKALPCYGMLLVGAALVFSGCQSAPHDRVPVPKRIVDLSPPLSANTLELQLGQRVVEFLGLPSRLRFRPVVPPTPDHSFGLVVYELPSHTGAHVDAPGRLLKHGERVDQIGLEKLVGPARVLDLRWKGQRSQIEATDLENYQIDSGDVVILFVGYTPPSTNSDWPKYPTISRESALWLANRKVRAVATDAPSLGDFQRYAELLSQNRPPEEVWAERIPLFRAGIPVVEGLVNVEQLLGEDRVQLIALPPPVADRSGSPARVVAMIY
jgi:arylformamidase